MDKKSVARSALIFCIIFLISCKQYWLLDIDLTIIDISTLLEGLSNYFWLFE